MKLGIIGGLGPLSSAYFYELLTIMSDVSTDQDHLEIYLHSYPQIPDRTQYILDTNQQNPFPYLIQSALNLEKLNVDMIVIPCLTAHYFYDEMCQQLNIPLLNIIHEICDEIEREKIQCVGIMATDGTIESQLFQKELNKRHIQYCLPKGKYQNNVMHIIYKNVKANLPVERQRFMDTAQHLFNQGAQKIILGCTELSIANKELKLDDSYLDGLRLTACQILKACHISIKKEFLYENK